jgi:hemoglobin
LEKCIAFGKRSYSKYIPIQAVLPPHKQLPVAKEHFDRWMEIFTTTTDELFAGARAEEAKLRANMAEMFNYKINYFRDADQKEIS